MVSLSEINEFERNPYDRYVIHHKDLDGYASAWAASHDPDWRLAQYIPIHYGTAFPAGLIYPAAEILVLDFSFDRAVLAEVHSKVTAIRVIDHHDTARDDLKGLDYCVFDDTECGATLTWKTLFPQQPVPQILNLVKDWDLFTLKDPRTMAFKIGMERFGDMSDKFHWSMLRRTWGDFEANMPHPSWDFYEKGKVLADEMQIQFKRMVDGKFYRRVWLNSVLDDYMDDMGQTFFSQDTDIRVAFYHEAENISLKAKYIYDNDKTIDATISYFQATDGQIVFNLRSSERTGKAHLGRLARTIRHACRTNSGGGHRHAAGFSLPATQGVRLLSIFMLK